jgi:hypothetical protein
MAKKLLGRVKAPLPVRSTLDNLDPHCTASTNKTVTGIWSGPKATTTPGVRDAAAQQRNVSSQSCLSLQYHVTICHA